MRFISGCQHWCRKGVRGAAQGPHFFEFPATKQVKAHYNCFYPVLPDELSFLQVREESETSGQERIRRQLERVGISPAVDTAHETPKFDFVSVPDRI